ncbi:MAG: hypothetical protein ACMXX9_03455 [Candidatus Woesearchaeota archaeon]
MVRNLLFIAAFLIGIGLFIPLIQAQACDPDSDEACGSFSITEPGTGAVQLCENCFICGVSDGVCPEDFASDEMETVPERLRIQLKGDNTIRPNDFDEYSIIYNTGDEACPILGGTCQSIERYDGESWNASSITCSQDISNEEEALRAVCTNVPRTAGCYNCPDPDCTNTLRINTFDSTTGEPIPRASLRFTPENPQSTVSPIEIVVNEDGKLETDGIRGNFNVECVKENYEPFDIESLFIHRGTMIIDCPLREASCNENQCTIDNVDGVPICRSFCEGQNNCSFNMPYSEVLDQNISIADTCNGRPAGSTVTLGRINDTHVEVAQCCNQDTQIISRPILEISGDVSDLLTRDFVRTLNNEQITVKIAIYRN